jgi:hypothetical protein
MATAPWRWKADDDEPGDEQVVEKEALFGEINEPQPCPLIPTATAA